MMSKRVGVEPHKGDIIKLLKKEKKSNPAIENQEIGPGDIEESEDDEEENQMERDAYIVEQRTVTRPITAFSRALSGFDKKSSIPETMIKGAITASEHEITRFGEELSAPRNPSSTHYTDFRNSRLISGKRDFSIKKLPRAETSKRSGLDVHQALQANRDHEEETRKPKIPRVQSSHPALKYGIKNEIRPLTQSKPRLLASSKRL